MTPPAEPAYALDEGRAARAFAKPKAKTAKGRTPRTRRATVEDYWSLPEDRRVELIDGVLYDQATPTRTHQDLAGYIYRKLANHVEDHGGACRVFIAPFAVDICSDGSNMLEPDVFVVCDPAKLSERCCTGAPDLVVEVVSPSSVRKDYLKKASLYSEAGVREYWIVDPSSSQTTVYLFYNETDWLSVHPFDAPCTVDVFGDLSIRLSDTL